MKKEKVEDLGFSFTQTKRGEILINRYGRAVTTLRNKKAIKFIKEIEFLEFKEQQQLMARFTGNYKRGNEKIKE